MVLDRNGVIIGRDAVIDVGGIIASTGDINVNQVMSGANKIDITNITDAAVVNNGLINAADAGLVGLVAKSAVNNGVIKAKVGRVALASGDKATVDLYGDQLIEIAVDSNLETALASNTGTINAEGGTVQMTASAAKNAVDNVVNMSGIINVSSVEVKGGKIILGGNGTTKVSGKAIASGKTGGGEIKVTGKDIEVAKGAILMADALETGNGGTVEVLADNNTVFEGDVYARGGSVSGNGGAVEISAKNQLGYDGSVNTTAANGEAGSLLFDPLFAIIHSGSLHNILGLQYILSAEALADDLARNGSLTVQADNSIDVGTDLPLLGNGPINLANYNYDTLNTNGSPFPWNWTITNHSGITSGNITLRADTINFNKDLTIGSGTLTTQANTLNLNSKLYGYNAAKTVKSLLADSRLIGAGTVSSINVLSNKALINQAIAFSDDASALTTITVSNGTYTENVNLDKSNVKLQSKNGKASTIINGTAGTGALGTVVVGDNVNDVQIGAAGKGFTINGFDSSNPGIENAALYFQGNHNNVTVKGNEIVAKGDSALATEYGRTNSNFIIDGNTFSGKTYNGASGAWGVGDQFTVANVPRQLVALNLGHSNLTFSNNQVVGDAGDRQLVALESNGATVSGNVFDGLSTSAALRVRGSNITVSDNEIDGNGVVKTGIQAQNVAGLTIGGATAADGNTIKDIASGWSNSGINVLNGSNVTIANNELTDVGGQSIYVEGPYGAPATKLDILDNKITNAEHNGIYVKKWNGADIKGNTIDNTIYGHGILLELTTGTDVIGNTVKLTDAGINLYYGNDGTTIQSNTLTDNKYGVRLENVGDGNTNTLIGFTGIEDPAAKANTITGGETGIKVEGGGNLRIAGNTVSGQGSHGIDIKNSGGAYNIVYFNKVGGTSGDAIRLAGTTALIADNRIGLVSPVAGNGIFVIDGDDTQILSNQVSNATLDGINVQDSADVTIDHNKISHTGRTGIFVDPSPGTIVSANTIDNTGSHGVHILDSINSFVKNNFIGTNGGNNNINGDGVLVENSAGTTVSGNTIKEATSTATDVGSGVHILNSGNSTVSGNKISDTEWDGVKVTGGSGIKVLNNDIDDVVRVGVYSKNGSNLLVQGNLIDGSGLDGIRMLTMSTTTVDNNTIDNAGDNGISAKNSKAINIKNNKIGTGVGSTVTNDGIDVVDSAAAQITANTVKNVSGNGIYSSNNNDVKIAKNIITGSGLDGVHVTGGKNATVGGANATFANIIKDSGNDGIDVRDVTGVATIKYNEIDGTDAFFGSYGMDGNNGIEVRNLTNAVIDHNTIKNSGWVGIELLNNTGTKVTNNNVDNSRYDGLSTTDGSGLLIDKNTLTTSGASGIALHNTSGVTASNNTVTNTAYLGIYGQNTNDIQILGNTVTNTGTAVGGYAPYGTGIGVESAANVTIKDNTVKTAKGDGISVGVGINNGDGTSTNVKVDNNNVSGVGGDGVIVTANAKSVSTNTISDTAGEGIDVRNSAGVEIKGNTVDDTGSHAIRILNSINAILQSNLIGTSGVDNNINGDGILVEMSNGTKVTKNTITETTSTADDIGSGVHIVLSDNVKVGGAAADKNTISNAEWDGVKVTGGDKVTVQNNDIDNVDRVGVYAKEGTNLLVKGNDIDGAGLHGVRIFKMGANTVVDGNFIDDVGVDGISVLATKGAVLKNNIIGANAAIGHDGINVVNSSLTQIQNNTVQNTGNVGIFVDPSPGTVVSGNVIHNTGSHGVHILGSINSFVTGNFIGFTDNTGTVSAGNNNINGDGVLVENSAGTRVRGNKITETTSTATDVGSGIHILNSNNAIVGGANAADRNVISEAEWDGVKITNSDNVTVRNNVASNLTRVGVYASDSSNTTVRDNIITNADLYGVRLLKASGVAVIDGNEINDTGIDAISVKGAKTVNILDNLIGLGADKTAGTADDTATGGNGISVANALLANVLDNIISNVSNSGVYLSLVGGKAVVSGNEVTDSDTGMYFESGLIDLRGATNTLTRGRVGYHFEPTGLNSVNLVGNTIGTTIFDGQTQYYVELANGALFNPGTPTIIDGTDASFDGYVPNINGLNMSQAQYDSIEDRIQHYNDDTTLGLFFFGFPPSVEIDQSDIFRDIAEIPGAAGRFNITIRGLPRIEGVTIPNAPAGNTAFSLNDITPAAGEGENEQTAANPENLQNIAPAAGAGENVVEVKNWNAAIDAASQGQVVNYSFAADGSDALSGL